MCPELRHKHAQGSLDNVHFKVQWDCPMERRLRQAPRIAIKLVSAMSIAAHVHLLASFVCQPSPANVFVEAAPHRPMQQLCSGSRGKIHDIQ